MNAIETIEKSLETHVQWLDYYKKNPHAEDLPENDSAGNEDHQQKCIDRYKKAITEIRKDKNHIIKLENILDMAASEDIEGCYKIIQDWSNNDLEPKRPSR